MPEPDPQAQALVSADDYMAVVRAYADRVHDLLRRCRCASDEAIELVAATGLDLLTTLRRQPDQVGDLAGWWFGRALADGERRGDPGSAGGEDEAHQHAGGLLAGTEPEQRVRAALESLPAGERTAVLLRDSYDLPLPAVAVALRRPMGAAARLIAGGRARLVAVYDGTAVPTLAGHSRRPAVDGARLAQLADGSLPGGGSAVSREQRRKGAALRRHTRDCPDCRAVLEAHTRARKLAAGLAVIAVPDGERDTLLDTLDARARAVLPTLDQLLADADAQPRRPAVPALVTVAGVILAAGLGVAVAYGTTGASGTARATNPAEPSSSAQRPKGPVTIDVRPNHGSNGALVAVTGSGWQAGTVVRLSFRAGGRSTDQAIVAPHQDGTFAATLSADDSARHRRTDQVRAQSGQQQVSVAFRHTGAVPK